MAAIIYSLCALLSLGIAVLLWRHFSRSRSRLIYWSAWCFTGLTANNVLLVIDKVVLVHQDLSLVRQLTALASLAMLIFGLVYEDE
ncbi:MAG: hypothetical protein EON93_00650 [Burkholderiales bacterium]|nr:MAG: hypothetical protein EON93_00650 [Burkholderiales bacterium]